MKLYSLLSTCLRSNWMQFGNAELFVVGMLLSEIVPVIWRKLLESEVLQYGILEYWHQDCSKKMKILFSYISIIWVSRICNYFLANCIYQKIGLFHVSIILILISYSSHKVKFSLHSTCVLFYVEGRDKTYLTYACKYHGSCA